MRQKHLEIALTSINHKFESPRIELEQYSTSPNLAACVIQAAVQNGDLGEGCTVCDLGCGTGILSIASALEECDNVISIDMCKNALNQAYENAKQLDVEHKIDFIQTELNYSSSDFAVSSDATSPTCKKKSSKKSRKKRITTSRILDQELQLEIPHYEQINDGIPLLNKCVDTVLTNPPFGTKNNPGIDVAFLATACRLAKKSIYSFHKTSTRKFLLKKITTEWNLGASVVAEMKFDIPNMYKFHKKKNVDVCVDLIHIWHLDDDGDHDDKDFNCIANELNQLSINSPHDRDMIEDGDGSALAPFEINDSSDDE